ncbi:hypothetical protein [Adhaeribacter radiodurans]|uniref:Uncharacterized protein n=1 Tax=Adhaeribacter radiodurans TaxID=2745197 RepID=A0A7L7LEN3_9BACT|nr:hypothetical protein [Adhaeribacter radiodurans]QMU31217.1 hypothetical protein HUW48_25725 [Adhaeribacter radiodurans]
MKIVNQINHENYHERLNELINPSLNLLQNNRNTNKKKILEVCHTGKFLMFFKNLKIQKLYERPDFILAQDDILIGLEHEVLLSQSHKEKEGFYDNIFSMVEEDLRSEKQLPNFLANCYLNKYLDFQPKHKPEIRTILKDVITEFVLTNQLVENPLIDRIFKMPHSQISLCPNLGAWWQQNLSEQNLLEAIMKKEEKVIDYKKAGCDKLWLLIVVGSTGESSYEIPDNLNFLFESVFDKVFLLEDFNNNLYQIN